MKQAAVAEYRLAVMVLARRSATKAVKARLKAKGINISYIPVRDIAAMARDHLAQNRAFFIVEAKQAIATRSSRGCAQKRRQSMEREMAWLLAQHYRSRA